MTKTYFWLKLKDDFFKSKEIKKLRKIAGGDTYTIIYLKLQLLSLKNDCIIKFDETEKDIYEQLELELDEDINNIKITISFLQSNNLIEIQQNDVLMLTTVENVGMETDFAIKKRDYRERLKQDKEKTLIGHCPTEIEIEKEKEIELDIKSSIQGYCDKKGLVYDSLFLNTPLVPPCQPPLVPPCLQLTTNNEQLTTNNIQKETEGVYKLYFLKEGKKKGIEKLISYLQKSKNMEIDIEKIKNHILQYNEKCKKDNYKFMKHFDTYINQEPWNDDIGNNQEQKQELQANIPYLAERLKNGFAIYINQAGARVAKSNIICDGGADYKLDEKQLKQLNNILGGSNE